VGKHDVEMTPAEQDEALQTARLLAKEFAEIGPVADSENRFPVEIVPRYKDTGLTTLGVPKRFGGMGGDIWTVARVSRELAKGDPAIALAFNMHQIMVGNLRGILEDETRERFFSDVVAGNKLICGAFSEERAGLMGLADTVAVPDGEGGWRISGRKTWGTLCQGADVVVFNATITEPDGNLPDDLGQHAAREGVFILSMDNPGISIVETWDTMGMRGTGTHTVVFDSAAAPPDSYGGHFRSKLFGEFEWNALLFAGVYCGLAEKVYEETREILKKKSLGATMEGADVALKGLGHVHHGLGRMCLETEVATRTLESTARILLEGRDADWNIVSRSAFIGVTKVVATETAISVADQALRLVGGGSFRRGHVLERLYRDARSGPFHPLTTDKLYETLGQSELGLFG